jgi:hypothetical protein
MTCSWCDKNISFVRSLTDTRYCCDGHRVEERQHLRQLAIQRLRGTPAFEAPVREEALPLAEAPNAAQGTPNKVVPAFEPSQA